MKTLKFKPHLIPLVLSGEKTITWRLWDDKDLQVNDIVECLNWETKEPFAKIKIIRISDTILGNVTSEEQDGHEKFKDDQEMYDTYTNYYTKIVNSETPLKVVWFEVIK